MAEIKTTEPIARYTLAERLTGPYAGGQVAPTLSLIHVERGLDWDTALEMSRQRGAEYRAGGWVWTGGSRHEVDFFDPRSRHHIQLEIVADDRAPEERPGAVLPGVEPEADADGVSGQDRDSYADDQDRDSYTAPAEATAAEAFPIDRVWVAVEQSRIYAHCIGVGVTLLAATKLAEDHAAQCGYTRERWRDERHPELDGETLHAYRIGETGARVEYRYRVLPYDIAGRA